MPDKKLTPEQIAANRHLLAHVRDWMKLRDVSQRQLADALNLSEPTISKWLRGTVAVTVAQFTQIATFLDATPEELLSAPADTQRAARYRQVAEIAAAMPDDALQEWLALGRRLAGGNP